jgi:DNA-binding CsgD family transcriptional regulator
VGRGRRFFVKSPSPSPTTVVKTEADAEVLRWLHAYHVKGKSFVQIADEAGISYETARKRARRLMQLLLKGSGVAVFLFFVFICSSQLRLMRGPRNDVAHRDVIQPDPAGNMRPAGDTDPIARAKALREHAFKECDAKRYGTCHDALNQAFYLDPAGDQDPRVQAARRAIDADDGTYDAKPTPPSLQKPRQK